jgi:hypothetical protein
MNTRVRAIQTLLREMRFIDASCDVGGCVTTMCWPCGRFTLMVVLTSPPPAGTRFPTGILLLRRFPDALSLGITAIPGHGWLDRPRHGASPGNPDELRVGGEAYGAGFLGFPPLLSVGSLLDAQAPAERVQHRRPGQRSSRGRSLPNRVFRPHAFALSPSPLRPNLAGALRENTATLGGPAVARAARVSLKFHPRFHLTERKDRPSRLCAPSRFVNRSSSDGEVLSRKQAYP